MDTGNVDSKDEFKRIWINEKENRWKEIRIYYQFVREVPESTDAKETWKWLKKLI